MSKAERRRAVAEKKQHEQRRRQLVGIAALVVLLVGMAVTFIFWGTQEGTSRPDGNARLTALAGDDPPMFGDPAAKVHIVEFLDPACGTCALFFPMVKGWIGEAPDRIRLSIRHVAFHEGAEYAVRILEASRNQGKYWETLESMLATQREWVANHVVQPDRIGPAIAHVGLDVDRLMTDMNAEEITQRIERDKQDAVTLRVGATPEYFVNGRPLPSFGRQQLLDLVREEMNKAY